MPWLSNIIIKFFPNVANEVAGHYKKDDSLETESLKRYIDELLEKIETTQNNHILDIAEIHEKYIEEKLELISKHDMLLIQEASNIRTSIENEKNKELEDMEESIKILNEENENFRLLLSKFNIVL